MGGITRLARLEGSRRFLAFEGIERFRRSDDRAAGRRSGQLAILYRFDVVVVIVVAAASSPSRGRSRTNFDGRRIRQFDGIEVSRRRRRRRVMPQLFRLAVQSSIRAIIVLRGIVGAFASETSSAVDASTSGQRRGSSVRGRRLYLLLLAHLTVGTFAARATVKTAGRLRNAMLRWLLLYFVLLLLMMMFGLRTAVAPSQTTGFSGRLLFNDLDGRLMDLQFVTTSAASTHASPSSASVARNDTRLFTHFHRGIVP